MLEVQKFESNKGVSNPAAGKIRTKRGAKLPSYQLSPFGKIR